TLSLVVEFTNSACARLMAPFQCAYRLRAESRLVVAGVIKAAPDPETSVIGGKLPLNVGKVLSRGFRKKNGLLDSDFIHISDPVGDFFGRFGVDVGMHINDRKFRLGNFCNGNLVKGFWPVIFQQYLFGRSLLGCFLGI